MSIGGAKFVKNRGKKTELPSIFSAKTVKSLSVLVYFFKAVDHSLPFYKNLPYSDPGLSDVKLISALSAGSLIGGSKKILTLR